MTEKKPIIGILANQREHNYSDNIGNIPWTYVPSSFVTGVQAAGGIPLIIPISNDAQALDTYIQMVDKLILIGGQHVSPALFGQKKAAANPDYFPERDEFELAMIELARKHQKPLFTVCRGTQLVNVALGGNLNQDIIGHWQEAESYEATQNIAFEPSSFLADIYGKTNTVNSYHQQSIDKLADGLRVLAQDPIDGTIEAVESTLPDFTFLGVQWHPEHLKDSRQADQNLFHYVVHEL